MFALLDFRPEIQIFKITISTIPMHQNRSISLFQIVQGGQAAANYCVYIEIMSVALKIPPSVSHCSEIIVNVNTSVGVGILSWPRQLRKVAEVESKLKTCKEAKFLGVKLSSFWFNL